jgi:hypothetical protein
MALLDKRSAQGIVDCALQELEMLRFYQTKQTEVFVDQAKHYFLDAAKSDWRSAGLLYYYSFLNLAKAYLIVKDQVDFTTLTTTKGYHGLQADPQDVTSILQFKLTISPQSSKGRVNVFSTMYQALIGEPWPFAKKLTISVSDMANHFIDIGDELLRLFEISTELCYVQSVIRAQGNGAWFEILSLDDAAKRIKRSMPSWSLTLQPCANMSPSDQIEWFFAYSRSLTSMNGFTLIRGPTEEDEKGVNHAISKVAIATLKAFSGLAIPTSQRLDECWLFIPRIKLGGKDLFWHPMLSDYLFAFVLGTILRYQPHVLKRGSKDYFLCEAWCRQAAVTTLRYFLMVSTSPGIRVHTMG